ncbi:hypothetical protein [Pseudonocardia sp. Ae717_Ps2]|uniref:hypothetical protein n=1 Tax=Pseudonocardia sp. Ae717_Ps2 TaxID=1885573 RepID=UPI0018E9B45D|nr:hypothetical protein [Pseudonocardia sp. Ae717_Ps2]
MVTQVLVHPSAQLTEVRLQVDQLLAVDPARSSTRGVKFTKLSEDLWDGTSGAHQVVDGDQGVPSRSEVGRGLDALAAESR